MQYDSELLEEWIEDDLNIDQEINLFNTLNEYNRWNDYDYIYTEEDLLILFDESVYNFVVQNLWIDSTEYFVYTSLDYVIFYSAYSLKKEYNLNGKLITKIKESTENALFKSLRECKLLDSFNLNNFD